MNILLKSLINEKKQAHKKAQERNIPKIFFLEYQKMIDDTIQFFYGKKRIKK